MGGFAVGKPLNKTRNLVMKCSVKGGTGEEKTYRRGCQRADRVGPGEAQLGHCGHYSEPLRKTLESENVDVEGAMWTLE